ncbi:response regulator transcription factor [Novipirellula rosea]|uniref:Response regulator transcription factor n=1 Tax=Novipirellula rosea TaxID=1031540 RepID=A0ABP8NP85_9BACT
MTTTSTSGKPARIAVVDDHGIVRFGYAQLINQEPTLEVCGMASTEQEGLQMLREQQPDLAIIDLSLDEGDGLDLIKSAMSINPEIKILVISAHDENLYAHRVLAAGALGFINKRRAPEKLIDGIQAILRGNFFFSEEVTKTLIRGRVGNHRTLAPVGIDSLTNRELQVLEHVGKGQCTRQIADAMYLSAKTIERHKENIKQKLGIENATQLVQRATQWVLGRGF